MPSDSAKKWVEYLGDVDKVLQMAKADFDKGEYQWVAEVTNTIVFADPTNTDARLLCADALEQLGYQAESGPWRNEYLTAAQELRHGNANFTASTKSTGDMVKALSAPMLFDYMAIVMDKQALADRDFTMNVILPDVGEQHMLRVKNGVLLVYADTLSDDADVSITCPKNALFAILTNNQETVAKAVKVEGSAELLTLMMENMNQLPITGTNPFNIIDRNGFAGRSVGRPPRSRENSKMLSTQIKSCLFLLETDSFCVSKNLPLRDRLPRYGGGGACARGGAVPRRGGGREPCHSPKYFGQPYSSLPHRLRAEPPRRGGQGVSTPFSTVCGSPAREGSVSGFPHFNKPCLSCYFVGLHGVFHSFNMVFHISTVERCRKPVQNVEKARRSPPRRDFLRFVQSCFTRCSFFGSML